MYLSLPLPTVKARTVYVTVIDMSGCNAPCKYAVEVMKTANIRRVYSALGELLGLNGSTTSYNGQGLGDSKSVGGMNDGVHQQQQTKVTERLLLCSFAKGETKWLLDLEVRFYDFAFV